MQLKTKSDWIAKAQELEVAFNASEHMRKTEKEWCKKEVEESSCHKRMRQAQKRSEELMDIVAQSLDGFYEISMLCGEETRVYEGVTYREQINNVVKLAHKNRDEIIKRRNNATRN